MRASTSACRNGPGSRETSTTLCCRPCRAPRWWADDALTRPDDAARMRRAMEQVFTWLDQASKEGRATVNLLRAPATDHNDLADAFRRAIDDCGRQGSLQASLSVTGGARESCIRWSAM